MKILVKKVREELGISRKSLADEVGFSENYIQKIEQGSRNPTLETLFKIAKAMGKSIHDLLED